MTAAKYIIAGVLFFSFGLPLAHAGFLPLSSEPIWAEAPLKAFCQGYRYSFQPGKHYTPQTGGCTTSIPKSLTDTTRVGLYKGVIGSSTLESTEDVLPWLNLTRMQFGSNTFYDAQPEQDYFFVAYSYDPSNPLAFQEYLTGATTTLPVGMVENQTYYILPWKWGEKVPSEHNPVIIIPGILGSWEKSGQWVLDPILHTYDNLIDTFLANGYEEGKTLFKFPYDWKKSNVTTAALLGQKIEEIEQVCDCSRVDIVAHSMGGLVATQYIESDDFKDDVGDIFFLGTPFGGSVKAYKTWEAGDVGFGREIDNAIMNRIFTKESNENGFSNTFDYIRSGLVPSVQELLPVYPNYLKTDASADYLQYPSGYPQNTFLADMEKTYSIRVYEHTDQRVLTGNTGATSTMSGFLITPSTQPSRWEDGQPIATYFDKGDGSVLEASAARFSGPDKEFIGSDHSQLVSTSSSYILEKLNGIFPQTIVDNIYGFLNIDFSVLIGKFSPSPSEFKELVETVKDLLPYANTPLGRVLIITLFSPIDMQVVAPDGKRLGEDFTTGNELHEIPNAIYSGPNAEHEYAIILDPLPGEYKVQTIGTGNGAYTVAAGYATAATTSETLLSGTAVLEQTESSKLVISATTTVITLTPSATSSPVTPIPPSATSTPTKITPATCVADMKTAYLNKWIPKKAVYTKLTARCQLLKKLFTTRDKLKVVSLPKAKKLNAALLKATNAAIRRTLDGMDKLAKEKSIKKEGRALITKNTTWFRTHELH